MTHVSLVVGSGLKAVVAGFESPCVSVGAHTVERRMMGCMARCSGV